MQFQKVIFIIFALAMGAIAAPVPEPDAAVEVDPRGCQNGDVMCL
jgi:hypothetical protein